ncbi:hypothetical protein TI05_05805 [Achromatium sp. WMS3]|nr:hypothetical protein TI05_05805 [Achromatium sp. WMS3]
MSNNSKDNPPQTTSKVYYIQVDIDHNGQRLDNFLLTKLKGLPRNLIYRILRTGQVRVNKGRTKADYRICAGDQIRIPPLQITTPSQKSIPTPTQLKTLEDAILHEDAQILILNKPAGIAVHGGSGISYGVIEILRTLRSSNLELVHRLDRDTSGCLIIAKRRAALRWLHQALREGTIHKRYTALLTGRLKKSITTVDVPLLKNRLQNGERIVRVDLLGKPSKTQFKLIHQFNNVCLVNVFPQTGRTHQIRVHAAHLGMSIAGDVKYGQRSINANLRDLGLKRLFLHAANIKIPLSYGSKYLDITAALDSQLESFLQRLA